MISVVIPTRNRGYTLKKVLKTYYNQKNVNQIIIVDDASSDNTDQTVNTTASKYPAIETVSVKNSTQKGASYSRNRGVSLAKNELVLFGEDDAYLFDSYTEVLLKKLSEGVSSIAIVSGRLVNLHPGEDPYQAIKRFGNGDPKKKKMFSLVKFQHIPDAYYESDQYLPLTHALILTHKKLLEKFPYDSNYSKGNGYREESDFQANALVHGYKILVTNETHCMHLHPKDVRVGGHRTPYFERLCCNIYYTNYFFGKYYKGFQKRLNLKLPRWVAMTLFSYTQVWELTRAFFDFIFKK